MASESASNQTRPFDPVEYFKHEYQPAPQEEPQQPEQRSFSYPETAYAQASLGITPGDEIERRTFYVEQCVRTLREAQRILRDEKLMTDIRAYIRRERDDLGALLDG